MISLWAHGGQTDVHEHVAQGLPLWTIVAVGAGLLFLVGWAALYWESKYRASAERAKRARRSALEAWIRKRRIGYVGSAIVVVVATITVLVANGAEDAPQDPSGPDEPVVVATPVDTSTPAPGDRFPIVFRKASSDGTIRVKVTNKTDRFAYVQCIVDARDVSGSSVIEGTYEAFEADGDEYRSNEYATVLLVDAGATIPLGVNLRVGGQVASVEGACGEVPEPPIEGG